MKLTLVLLTVAFLQVSATGTAQTVTLSERNASLNRLFALIKQQTGYSFFITDNDALQSSGPVNIQVKKAPLTQALDLILQGQPFTYQIFGNIIAIKQRRPPQAPPPAPDTTVQQKHLVTGHVTSEEGTPLPGVSVQVKGTAQGVITDAAGNFRLNVADDAVLLVSFIGYQSQETSIAKGQRELNIQLKATASGLNEIVVVAYGTQKRADLTGSIASVGGAELKRTPAMSITNSLTGLMPGLVTKNISGEPGKDDATILIRGRNTTGNNNPLIVVDGIQLAGAQDAPGWQRINPNDIESISVLKDASAAIYGAQAANGVILITTKRGVTGKPVISYTFNQGINQPTKIPEMGNSATLAGYFNEMLVKQGQQPRYTEEEIRKFADGSDPVNYPNVRWFDEVLKKFSLQSQHNINVRGGSKDVKYLISGSYSNQNSIFRNGSHNFKTYALRSNLDAQISKDIKVGLDLNGGIDEGNYPSYSTTQTFQALNYNLPFMPVYYANGLPSAGIERGENPVMMASGASGNIGNTIQRFSAKAMFDINIPWVQGLGFDGYFNYRNVVTINKNWQTPWTVYNYDKTNDTYLPVTGGGIVRPQLEQSLNYSRNTLVNLRLKYDRRFGEQNLNTFVAMEESRGKTNDFSAFRRDFISASLDELFAGSLLNQQADGSALETGRRNFFGRVHYDFREKYLLDFNFRYDGSSNFPKGRRYGFFPGIAVAWKLSEEGFIKYNTTFINSLKLRASVGRMGNDRIDPFQFMRLYTLNEEGYNFGLPPAQSLGLIAGVTPNPNVTWEVATISNIGLDGTLGNGLLGFTIDVFKQKRSNILATRDLAVPAYTGLSLPSENIGVVENKGFEIGLTHTGTRKAFSYTVAANFAYAANKVLDVSEASNVPLWQKLEGHAIGAERYYISQGIIRTKEELASIPVVPGTEVGDLRYEDVNKDGSITAADQVRLDRTSTPRINYGVSLSMSYKAFSLFTNFAGAAQSWQFFRFQALLGTNSLQDLLENRYTPGSMDSKYPTLPQQSGVNTLQSTFWLYNTSFLRLKTLELGYNLPADLLSSVKISSARLYLSGSNLFTFSRMKLFDPEGTNTNGFFYPQSRIYNIGINVTF